MSNSDENLLAILGPTNTGKTYAAFEKLLSYSSGIFGFPLRLLARENYDKADAWGGFLKSGRVDCERAAIQSRNGVKRSRVYPRRLGIQRCPTRRAPLCLSLLEWQ